MVDYYHLVRERLDTSSGDTVSGDTTYVDVLVVGGGITGAGVALDAASRGLSVALVEQADLAALDRRDAHAES